jgi:hypothetical protein
MYSTANIADRKKSMGSMYYRSTSSNKENKCPDCAIPMNQKRKGCDLEMSVDVGKKYEYNKIFESD